jgi:hypothetical protein
MCDTVSILLRDTLLVHRHAAGTRYRLVLSLQGGLLLLIGGRLRDRGVEHYRVQDALRYHKASIPSCIRRFLL